MAKKKTVRRKAAKKKPVKRKAAKKTTKRKVIKKTVKPSWVPAPLPSSFLLTAILGFVISALWVFPMSYTWGITFMIFFTLMFITAFVNLSRAPSSAQSAELRK